MTGWSVDIGIGGRVVLVPPRHGKTIARGRIVINERMEIVEQRSIPRFSWLRRALPRAMRGER